MSKTAKAIVACVISTVFFGLSFIFVKLCVTDVSPFDMLAWRNLIALAVMALLIATGVFKVKLRGKNVKALILMSLFEPVFYFIFEAWGVKLTTASESGIIISCIPIVTMIFSAVFLREKPTGRQAFFMVMTVAGAAIVAGVGGLQTSSSLPGYLMLIGAVCCDSAAAIISQKLTEFNAVEKAFTMCASGAVAFTICALVSHGAAGNVADFFTLPLRDTGFLTCVLYLSIGCTVTAFTFANYAINIIGATRRAAFAGVSTVVTIVAGVFYLHEPFSLIQGLASVMIIGGVTGVNMVKKSTAADDASAANEAAADDASAENDAAADGASAANETAADDGGREE